MVDHKPTLNTLGLLRVEQKKPYSRYVLTQLNTVIVCLVCDIHYLILLFPCITTVIKTPDIMPPAGTGEAANAEVETIIKETRVDPVCSLCLPPSFAYSMVGRRDRVVLQTTIFQFKLCRPLDALNINSRRITQSFPVASAYFTFTLLWQDH